VTSQERLPRLLALVPYLIARPGIAIDEAAADLGVTSRQLRKDLELLWMCGLPGYGPGDLIDLSMDEDTVTVTYDAGMRRPLRLTGAEATALLVALRALLDTPGMVDADAVRRAVAKIESAAGQAQPAGVAVGLGVREGASTANARRVVQEALRDGRALRITYYTASKDQITERTVDPMRLLFVDGHWYLEAWCRRAEGVRLFRLDRVDDVAVLDEPAAPPPQAHERDVDGGVYQPEPGAPAVRLRLARSARWVAEYYPVEKATPVDDPPGGLAVVLRTAELAWARRLVASLGGAALVDEPAELAAQVAADARAALARYGEAATPPAAR
jgi:proteasome accessory factor C